MEPVTTLVVDDSEHYRYFVRHAASLDPRFKIVGEADQGAEGIRLVGELKPHVVLLDLHMPMLDGLESIDGIRAMSPRSKILIWSGYADSFGADAVALGADEFISKTTPLRDLAGHIVGLAARDIKHEIPDQQWVQPYVLKSLTQLGTDSQPA